MRPPSEIIRANKKYSSEVFKFSSSLICLVNFMGTIINLGYLMLKIATILIFSLYSALALSNNTQELNWKSLLDPELSDWEAFLSYKHQINYNGAIPKDHNGNNLEPIGLLDSPNDYGIYVVLEGDTPILKVSGEIYGGLTTKKSYRNYQFRLKYKWGRKVYPPREKLLKDSGILYHAIGEHGKDYWRTWKVSQEFQIMLGHVGDYWNQGNSAIDVRAYIPEHIMNPIADESQQFISVGSGQDISGFVLRKENFEEPEGEWNEIELVCFEGKSLHIVNGKVVMVLKNSRTVDDRGMITPLREGQIQLQSEAAEIFYKDIFVRKINELPAKYRHLF
ncbi:conserved hypothetical protein [Alteromonas sp. 38]|uniref:3-keto-disaccharide hydrolase n=1 Tax=Alteromonas TaxID=226 RepID=UPI0012F0FC0D|nr:MULTISPECIES: DUF1080 domain-containing protein [unclassified Alteromonas]CAD5272915.1 conserved hypothetical protein [Alteromonas sp. 154]VXB54356.1 conserved hypothetical protein [Alteromonas sp. 38]